MNELDNYNILGKLRQFLNDEPSSINNKSNMNISFQIISNIRKHIRNYLCILNTNLIKTNKLL